MKDGVPAQHYLDLELLNKQIQNLESTVESTDREIERTHLAMQMLEQFSEASPGQELLIPVGSGSFCNVQVAQETKVKMLVGAGVLVERSPKDATAGLAQQVNELKKQRSQSLELREQIIDKILDLQQKIESELEKK